MAKNETAPARSFESLMDEAYLVILCRRPTPDALAQTIGVPRRVSDQVVRRLSTDLKRKGFRVRAVLSGKVKKLEVRQLLRGSAGKPALIGPETLRARRLPSRRPGFKPEDEIVYARDW